MELAERVARLERENRVLRRGVVLLIACAGLVLLSGQGKTPPDTIEGRAFVLRDREGMKRGGLWLTDDDHDVVLEVGSEAFGRATLTATKEADTSLTMGLGKHVFVLRVRDQEPSGFEFRDRDGGPCATLELHGGRPRLTLRGRSAGVSVRGSEGSVGLGAGSHGAGLGVLDGRGLLRVRASCDKESDQAALHVWDSGGRRGESSARPPRFEVSAGNKSPRLRLVDSDGTALLETTR